jgi:hypothetical protein
MSEMQVLYYWATPLVPDTFLKCESFTQISQSCTQKILQINGNTVKLKMLGKTECWKTFPINEPEIGLFKKLDI